MRTLWTVERTRAAEAGSGVAEQVLIDRASTAVAGRAVAMLDRVYGARVLVAAGPGHNGADALWAGWKLRQRGAAVDVGLPLGEPRDEHGAEPLRRLLASGARVVPKGHRYDLMVDGVLGTAARPSPPPEPGAPPDPPPWFGFRGGRILAVDVPTGVDPDTGAVAPYAVRADVTVTFGRMKPGLLIAADHAGLVEVAGIGLGAQAGWSGYPQTGEDLFAVTADDVLSFVRVPERSTHKYARGVVGVCAGSDEYPGAAVLTCRGALRAGCGYVRLVAPDAVGAEVRAAHPEVVAKDGYANVWVVGPGLGTDERAERLLREALATNAAVVLDADALTLVAEHKDLLRREAATVLTPHTGEFERLTGVSRDDAERDRIGVTRAAARELGVTVLLKGSTTVVSDGTVAVLNPSGTPWLGTAGTGDVLAGVVGAFLTRGRNDAVWAAASAAWVHGMAGRLAAGDPGAAVTAVDVADHLPAAARIALTPC